MTTFFINDTSSNNEDRLNKWREAIVCDCNNHNDVEQACRKRVLENFEMEPRLQSDIRNAFVTCLLEEFKGSCKDALDAIRRSLSKSVWLMLQGPKVRIKPNELCCVRTARTLRRNIEEPPYDQIQGNIFNDPRGTLADELIANNIQEGLRGPRHLFGTIRGKYPILWATSAENVNETLENGEGADEIRDMLGLDYESYKKDSYLVGLFYNQETVASNFTNEKGYHFPTVIEGGDSPSFKPAPDGAATGLTINLRDGSKGFPEVVHLPIENPSENINKLIVLGKLKTDTPNGYLDNYLP